MTIFQFFMDMNNLKCQHGNHISGFIIFISWDVENQPRIPIYIKIQQYKIHKAPLRSCIYLLYYGCPSQTEQRRKKHQLHSIPWSFWDTCWMCSCLSVQMCSQQLSTLTFSLFGKTAWTASSWGLTVFIEWPCPTFYMGDGDLNLVLMIAWQVLYQLSHLPKDLFFIIIHWPPLSTILPPNISIHNTTAWHNLSKNEHGAVEMTQQIKSAIWASLITRVQSPEAT